MSAMLITLLILASLIVVVYLALRSGERYQHGDAHAHSEEYAGVIREGHGPLTVFLIVTFLAIFVWTVAYFGIHGWEFSRFPGMIPSAVPRSCRCLSLCRRDEKASSLP